MSGPVYLNPKAAQRVRDTAVWDTTERKWNRTDDAAPENVTISPSAVPKAAIERLPNGTRGKAVLFFTSADEWRTARDTTGTNPTQRADRVVYDGRTWEVEDCHKTGGIPIAGWPSHYEVTALEVQPMTATPEGS